MGGGDGEIFYFCVTCYTLTTYNYTNYINTNIQAMKAYETHS